MQYEAILFDLDGTLVNTIKLYDEAVIQSMKNVGIPITKEQFRNWYLEGLHLSDWLRNFGFTEADVPNLRKDRDEIYQSLLRTKTEWYPGAKELLEGLSPLYPLGLVTGSWMKYIQEIDKVTPVSHYFQTIVTADDMGAFMKPHPHGLVLAADRLHVDPTKCLYIGDQLFDVHAAKAAGMTSCVIKTDYTPDLALTEANFTCDSLGDLLKKLL